MHPKEADLPQFLEIKEGHIVTAAEGGGATTTYVGKATGNTMPTTGAIAQIANENVDLGALHSIRQATMRDYQKAPAVNDVATSMNVLEQMGMEIDASTSDIVADAALPEPQSVPQQPFSLQQGYQR